MATIRTLNTQMLLQTSQFEAGARRVGTSIKRLEESWNRQADTIGMTARQMQIYDLEQRKVDKSVVDAFRAQDKAITEMERWEEAVRNAQRPLPALRQEIDKTSSSIGAMASRFKGFGALAAAFFAVKAGLDAVGDAAKDVENSMSFLDRLGERAQQIPLIGDIATAVARLGIELAGAGTYGQNLAERLETVQSRLGLTAREAERLSTVGGILKSLNDQVAYLGESSAVAAARAAGATQEAIIAIHVLEGRLTTIQTRMENQRAIDNMIAALERQADTFGMSARAIALYEASVLGASQADLDYINTLHDKLDAMQKMRDEQERINKLMEEGRRITDSVRTADEIYTDTLAKLTALLEAGAISEETYRRAVEKAKEERDRANKVEDKVPVRSQAWQFQSPEAIERRFASGMPTGMAQADSGLQLVKKTDMMLFGDRERLRVLRDQLSVLQEILTAQPTVYNAN